MSMKKLNHWKTLTRRWEHFRSHLEVQNLRLGDDKDENISSSLPKVRELHYVLQEDQRPRMNFGIVCKFEKMFLKIFSPPLALHA